MMKIDDFKKIWESDFDVTESFRTDITLNGIYAKYYQFLKEAYKKNPEDIDQLNRHIVEVGLTNIMKDIWTMLLASIAVAGSSEPSSEN
jgi:hypothetical protein